MARVSSLTTVGASKRPSHLPRQANRFEQHDRVPAEVELPGLPAEARGPWFRVVVAVPVLALKHVEESQPGDVLRGVLFRFAIVTHVRDAVDETLQVKGDGEDSSQNITWLGFLHFFQGENWHENHHAKPSSAKFGWTFWQIDFGWYVIVVLEKLRLAYNVKRPTFRSVVEPDDDDGFVAEPVTADA
jgi:hypothetical protein